MTDVPVVTAPMNFGLEYLGSPSHGNLRFLLVDDEELLSNSAIMLFNSPVIKKMTLEDGRTTVDVQDFSKEAVLCFLGASYSGTLSNISRAIFRDVNKMANVFNVTWLADRCFEYFKTLTDAVKEDCIADQVYIFEEAMLVLEKLKKRDYIEYVINKFTSLTSCTEYFVVNYLSDLSSCSQKNLDVIMEMTRDQPHILVKVLVKNMAIKAPSLDENSRCILKSINFATHPHNHDSLYQELYEKLELVENPCAEEYRLILRNLREMNNVKIETSSSEGRSDRKQTVLTKKNKFTLPFSRFPTD